MRDDLSVSAKLIGWTDPARARRTVSLAIGPGARYRRATAPFAGIRLATRARVAAIGAGAMAVTAGA